jgi:hypothetical protein
MMEWPNSDVGRRGHRLIHAEVQLIVVEVPHRIAVARTANAGR